MPPVTPPPMFFISYRRDDSGGHVGRLYDALVARFGSHRLFFDIDHIGVGQDFVQVLDDAVTRCSVLLVVMGKRWVGPGDAGARRIDDPGDFVRMEVAAGLKREGLRIIPVLVHGATMPSPESLPEDLRVLTRRNAFELSDLRWKDDVARLIDVLGRDAGPGGPGTLRGLTVPPWGKWAGAALAAALVAGLVVRGLSSSRAPGASVQAAGVPSAQAEISNSDAQLPTELAQFSPIVLDSARKWQKDAVLTQIQSEPLPGGPGPYRVEFMFTSPGAKTRLAWAGTQGGNLYRKTVPGSATAVHPLPGTFVELPTAVKVARVAGGMSAPVKRATLSASGSGAPAGQATWTIIPASATYQAYYVDAANGNLLSGSQSGQPATGKRPVNLPGAAVSKIKSLFGHH